MRLKITGYVTVDDGYYNHEDDAHVLTSAGYDHLRDYRVVDLIDVEVDVIGKPPAPEAAPPVARERIVCGHQTWKGRVDGENVYETCERAFSSPDALAEHQEEKGHG